MADPAETIDFREDDRGAVLSRMEGLATSRSGWVNLQPGIDPADEPPAPSPLAALFGVVSHPVPVLTWVPAHGGRRDADDVDTIGVQHARGGRVLRVLAEAGLALPDGWRPVQDHPRRGVVAELPVGTAPADVLDWLLRVGRLLATLPITGEWRAEFHQR